MGYQHCGQRHLPTLPQHGPVSPPYLKAFIVFVPCLGTHFIFSPWAFHFSVIILLQSSPLGMKYCFYAASCANSLLAFSPAVLNGLIQGFSTLALLTLSNRQLVFVEGAEDVEQPETGRNHLGPLWQWNTSPALWHSRKGAASRWVEKLPYRNYFVVWMMSLSLLAHCVQTQHCYSRLSLHCLIM